MHVRVLGICSALLLGAAAPADPPVPDRARVLAAIATMFAAPLKQPIDEERRLLADFAEHSDAVLIVFDPRYTRFMFESAPEYIKTDLFGFYIAGAVKFDLERPEQSSDPTADVAPALEAVLRRYSQMRATFKDYSSPFLESAAAAQARGMLSQFVQAQPEYVSPGDPLGR